MTIWIHYFQLINILLCLLLAAQFFFVSALRPIPKRLLGVSFLLYAHQSVILVANLNGQLLALSWLRPMGAMLIGPMLFMYVTCLQRSASSWDWKALFHPTLGCVAMLILLSIRPLRALIDFAILASFTGYLMLIAIRMRGAGSQLQHLGHHAPAARQWLLSLYAMAVVNVALEFAVVIEIKQGVALRESLALFVGSAAFVVVNGITIIAAMSRSDWLEWMYQFEEQTLQKPIPTIDTNLAEALFERWENLVKTEKLHKLEFGITLPQAAKKLQVPARHLSNTINQIYGKSFSVYLNDLRISEAQTLLRQQPDMPIIEVMQEAGFSSKSNFNKEFSRVTGMSPSAFRESVGKASPNY